MILSGEGGFIEGSSHPLLRSFKSIPTNLASLLDLEAYQFPLNRSTLAHTPLDYLALYAPLGDNEFL